MYTESVQKYDSETISSVYHLCTIADVIGPDKVRVLCRLLEAIGRDDLTPIVKKYIKDYGENSHS